MASAARRVPAIPISKYANVQAFQPAPKPVAVPKPDLSSERKRELRLAAKVDQAARVLDEIDAREADLKAAIKELQQALGILVRRRERIEDRFIAELQSGGFDKIHGGFAQFVLKPAPLALQVTDESKIPEEYFRESLSRSVDKTALKKAILAGLECDGVQLTQKVSLSRK